MPPNFLNMLWNVFLLFGFVWEKKRKQETEDWNTVYNLFEYCKNKKQNKTAFQMLSRPDTQKYLYFILAPKKEKTV